MVKSNTSPATLVDISGNGNNLTASGGGGIKTKDGIYFNGVNANYYSKTDATNVSLGTNPLTISCRAKIISFPVSGYNYFFGIGSASIGTAAVLGVDSSKKLVLSCFSAPVGTTTLSALEIGRIYTISAVLSGGKCSFYVDGVFIEQIS